MGKLIIKGSNYGFFVAWLIVFVHLGQSNSPQCQLRCVFSENGCKVCFQACIQNNPFTYSFASCAKNVTNQDRNLTKSGQISGTFNYDVVQCGKHCCDDRFKIFQNSHITVCPVPSNDQTTTAIIVISILTVVFVSLCCLVSGNAKIREKLFVWLCNQKKEKDESGAAASNNSTCIINAQEIKIGRKKQTQASPGCSNETCSICLEGMSNTVTQCGHSYHFRCIYEWSTRKPNCPLCKSPNIKKIIVYCEKCLKKKKEVGLRELPFMSLGELNAYKCVECRFK